MVPSLYFLSKAAWPKHINRRVIPRQTSRRVNRCSATVASSGRRRTFKFVPYGEQFQGDATTVCVDGLVKGVDLQLTHWTGNVTPDELYADTSTEIALNWVKQADQAGFEEALVLNNHYDSDGVLSAFVLLEPEIALRHEALLIAGAEAGDFDEWPADGLGIKLDAALCKLEGLGGGSEEQAYSRVLPQVGELLDTLEQREDLWGEAWHTVQRGMARVDSGDVRIECVGSIGVAVHAHGTAPLPGMVMSKALDSPRSGVKRFLWAFEPAADGGQWRYAYSRVGHAWVSKLAQRPTVPAPDVDALAAAMGAGWSSTGGMTALIAGSAAMSWQGVVDSLAEHDDAL